MKSFHSVSLRNVSSVLTAAVITTGLAVLAGWALQNEILKSVIPGLVAMNPATALAFILASLAVFLSAEERTGKARRAAKAAAAAVMLIGFSRILSYLTPLQIKIDQAFFYSKLGNNVMAPNTAWNFFLLGVSLLCIDAKHRGLIWARQLMILGALLTSMLAVIGYSYSAKALYNVPSYIPMALNTAVMFSLLTLNILFLRPSHGLMGLLTGQDAGSEVAKRLLPATVFVPVFFGGACLLGVKNGFYGTIIGVALMAVASMVVFAALVWWTANLISRADRARCEAEEKLRKAKDELELRVEQRTEELKKAQHQLVQQERLRALGEMASGIAHDFNNALSPILGYTELILDMDGLGDTAKVREQLKTINTAARDAAGIVARLMLFGRSRQQNEAFTAVDLKRLVEQAIVLTQPKWKTQAMTRGIEITIGKDLRPVPPVEGNEQQLREVLTNLIFNAVDAMPRSGSIILRVYPRDGQAVLEVSDTGSGMTEEVRQKCLEPFFSTKGEQGTGLGLAMVYGIIQRHEGKLEIQSEPGRGTSFLIQLPCTRPAAAASGGLEVKTKARTLAILYAEDDGMVQKVITQYLLHDGHRVETADNGAEALQKFYANQNRYDLVITDRTMPQMGGADLARSIKKLVPSQRIFLLSGTADFGKKDIFENVDAVLNKPVTLEELRKTIQEFFPPQ